ncbi:MAG: hypothetical protein Q4G33_10470, partial [bacterium]|nr:hypothetical protein [bacterium]
EGPTAKPGDPTAKPDKVTVYAENGIIIIATYNVNGSLAGIQVSSAVKENDKVQEITVAENQKAFVWTSFAQMKPVDTKEIP